MTFTTTMRDLLDLTLRGTRLTRRPSTLKVVGGLLAAGACGALAGAGVALLLAPAEGKKTRAKLAQGLKEALPHLGNGVPQQDWGRPAPLPVAD